MNQPGSFNTLEEWLPWLETLSPREIVLGLERVEEVLDRLAMARPPLVINIAGTNGKGSSAAMLESFLIAGGANTGCYTSPHIHRYNERIRIGGQPASDGAIVRALSLVEAVRGDLPLTFFEFGTLAALVAFDSAGVDAWILEVGMGGRLDAVNAIDPDACLITNVALDHCAWLGNDVESIGREKAGIMRAETPVVFGAADGPAAIEEMAGKTGALLSVAGRDFHFEQASPENSRWSWYGKNRTLEHLRVPALRGRVQLQNASAVLGLLESLGRDDLLDPEIVSKVLSDTRIDGRFQVLMRHCQWILDVAHNPDAARVLASNLAAQITDGRVTAIVGMLADKDIAGVLAPLGDIVDNWIAVTVAGSRAASATVLAGKIANACQKPCLVAEGIADAMAIAEKRSATGDTILVTGSFYLVGPALAWLGCN